MQYRTLGRTGIKVSPYALGTLMYAARTGNAPKESARIIDKALDADVNFLGTADAYGDCGEVAGQARGLPDAMIAVIAAGKRPEFQTGQEAPACDFTWQLYRTVCAVVNAFNVPVPAGTQPESSAP